MVLAAPQGSWFSVVDGDSPVSSFQKAQNTLTEGKGCVYMRKANQCQGFNA